MNRKTAESFIHSNFGGISQDWPWEDTPNYSVFRHVENKKWFALFLTVKVSTLARQNPTRFTAEIGTIDIINLKCDPDLVEEIIQKPGILPAYHMNKRHWITVLLDGSCPQDELQSLIALSYQLTSK